MDGRPRYGSGAQQVAKTQRIAYEDRGNGMTTQQEMQERLRSAVAYYDDVRNALNAADDEGVQPLTGVAESLLEAERRHMHEKLEARWVKGYNAGLAEARTRRWRWLFGWWTS